MNSFFEKFFQLVGGKRGLSVIGSLGLTALVATGKITAQTAGLIGSVCGGVGLLGIGANYGKNQVPKPLISPENISTIIQLIQPSMVQAVSQAVAANVPAPIVAEAAPIVSAVDTALQERDSKSKPAFA